MPNIVSNYILLLTVSPGRLGLTLNVNKNDPENGAVITAINPACTFRDQLEVGDRIVTIDGQKVTKIEDLHVNKDKLRKFGIAQKKNQGAAAASTVAAAGGGRVVTGEIGNSTPNLSAAAVRAAIVQRQQQQAMRQQYIIRLQQEKEANKPQTEKVETPKHPMVGLSKREDGNYNIVNQRETLKNVPKTEVISRIQTFIESLSQNKACIDKFGRRYTSCTCMQFLQNKPLVQLAMCHAILEYSDMTHVQKKHHNVERLRYAKMVSKMTPRERQSKKKTEQLFALPLSYRYLENNRVSIVDASSVTETAVANDSSHPLSSQEQQQQISEAFSHRVCEASWLRLLNIGHHAQKVHKQYIAGNLSIITHQNTGKKRKRKAEDAIEDLRASLQALHDEYINSSECKRKGDEFTLPVSISKRNYYESWCRERGWEPIKVDTTNGQYAKVKDFELLDGYYKTEELASLAEAEGRHVVGVAKEVISFANFNSSWNDLFPNMKTQGRIGRGLFIGDSYGSGKWDRNR